jgi:dolichol-phosphate mannosyltransferase
MNKNPKYSFIVPAYNEEANVNVLHKRIKSLMKNISDSWELIYINDGSKDNTLIILKKLVRKNQNVKYIDLSRNFGHQAALTAGYKHAKGKAVISLDCDLQAPPEVIFQMIEKWKQGFKIVYAKRTNYRKDNFFKRLGSKFYYKFLGRFTRIEIPKNVGDFRLIDKKVLDQINNMSEHSRYLRGMVAWTGFSHTFVDYNRPDRKNGKSAYSFAKLFLLGMDGMFNFSVLPLRLGFVLGVLSIITGFGLLFYQILDVIFTGAYYHLYKWLTVILFVFMGFVFILIWIIGEYIGKIYDESRNRPYYIINEKENF